MKLFSHILPYLLMVSFYSGQINNFGIDKIKAINESPYNGVAVMMTTAYDTHRHSDKEFEEAVQTLKKNSKKHIWPWIYFNRMIGYKEGDRSLSQLANVEYYRSIVGIDIYKRAGALKDFIELWKSSLRIARRLGSPGIVVDPEAYNNFENYKVSYLAKQLNKSEDEIIAQLESVGAELLDIAQQEYPAAELWFLFTGVGGPAEKLKAGKLSVTHIIEGMLKRAKTTKSDIKLISGGEFSLGYCHRSFRDLSQTVEKRGRAFTAALSFYPNLDLGGTIALWPSPSTKTGWLTRGVCGRSEFSNIEDFMPALNLLSITYKYVWVYAAAVSGYDPYDERAAAIINKHVGAIRDRR